MANALIYSAGFDGHRQVFVFVLSHILSDLKYNIFIAGNFKEKIINSLYIDKLKGNNDITLIDTSVYPQNGLNIGLIDFLELQNKHNIDLTFFAEADHHISLFNSQIYYKQSHLRGRTVGIFLRPFYYYEKLSLINKLRFLRNLKYNWKSDNRLFHELFLKHFRLLNSALYIDEDFVANHSYGKWLPDVFQQYAEIQVRDENTEQRFWIDKLNDFKEKNKDKFIFLYFGTSQKRRGYDLLLKMSVELNACFIHCGLIDTNEKYEINVNELRTALLDKGMLMETNQYISDPICIEHFFKSVNHMVLPYRNFWGSSGVMLQALTYGIPVLVPKKGIMGFRVNKYKLGFTYDGHYCSLLKQFDKFKEVSKNFFADDISLYMQFQSVDRLKEVIIKSLKD
jgi:glycosyltransferase involved in cell wall biosynthesis